MNMKKGQSIITLTIKETGVSYLFGSLSAIYAMFSPEELGVTYSALRNAVSAYIHSNKVDEKNNDFLQTIYDNKRSSFILKRAPLLLAEKEKR